jgi:hypothetical protein
MWWQHGSKVRGVEKEHGECIRQMRNVPRQLRCSVVSGNVIRQGKGKQTTSKYHLRGD